MTTDHAFGSNELSPEMLRSATFDEHDGLVRAADVRTYLDRVASSLEVFLSGDAPSALRAEFARNAEIAQQVLDAGQNAAEQLRRQAAEDAKRILDEARDATLELRRTVDDEIEQARTQVEAMRGAFIQDLRDLYDRIGASLYRFERAAEESSPAPIQEPSRAVVEQAAFDAPAATVPEPVFEAPGAIASEPAVEVPAQQPAAPVADVPEGIELPPDAKPPAWQQLPADAWASSDPQPAAPAPAEEPVAAEPAVAAPFDVVEDEPLAPGEPLVDLRDFGSTEPVEASDPVAPALDESPSDLGGSWLDTGGDDVPEVAPQAEPAPVVDAAPMADDLGGSWLDSPVVDEAPEPPADVARDDALAEALIAGDDPAPIGAPILDDPAPAETVSADALAVRQQILDLLASGQSRDSIEAYLANQLGMVNPGALIDAAINAGT